MLHTCITLYLKCKSSGIFVMASTRINNNLLKARDRPSSVQYKHTQPSLYITQQSQYIHPMLVRCWPSVVDGGPTLNQPRVNVSCLQGRWRKRHRVPINHETLNRCLSNVVLASATLAQHWTSTASMSSVHWVTYVSWIKKYLKLPALTMARRFTPLHTAGLLNYRENS